MFSADWDVVLHGATAVISTLGGVGTNEQMEKINGDANVVAVNAALAAGKDFPLRVIKMLPENK